MTNPGQWQDAYGRSGPTEEYPVFHMMDGRRIVGDRPTWSALRQHLQESEQ